MSQEVNTTLSHYEIERRYRTSDAEDTSIEAKLKRLGFSHEKTSIITDTLLPSPKDETLRIRREQIVDGLQACVLWMRTHKKHPVLPNGTHVRQEEESLISLETAEEEKTRAMHETCCALPSYSKTRRTFTGSWKGLKFTVCLDVAQGLCRYSGHYIEFEVLLPVGSKKVERVQRKIVRFAEYLLGDKRPPVMSYRKMLLRSIGKKG